MGTIRLSKLDAAARQIETAITLWFNDGDPVSVHSLACSAYQLVHDMNRTAGGRDLLYDSLVVKDEYRKEWVNTLKKSYNFLKHADRDPELSIEFDPSTSEGFIMFTCFGLELLGLKPTVVRAAFTLHRMLSTPEMLTEKGRSDLERYPEAMRRDALSVPKPLFLKTYIALHPTPVRPAQGDIV